MEEEEEEDEGRRNENKEEDEEQEEKERKKEEENKVKEKIHRGRHKAMLIAWRQAKTVCKWAAEDRGGAEGGLGGRGLPGTHLPEPQDDAKKRFCDEFVEIKINAINR